MLWLECQRKWKEMAPAWRRRRSSRTSTDAPESAPHQTHTHACTRACTNREQKEPCTGFLVFQSDLVSVREWAASVLATCSRDFSPAKWILHSADMWYLNFPLGVGNSMCRSEILGDPCWFRSLAARSQCVRTVIRMAAVRLPLLTGVTYIGTGASLWKLTIIEQKLYQATVIFSRGFKRVFF